jgi:hypothetical protein
VARRKTPTMLFEPHSIAGLLVTLGMLFGIVVAW